MSDSDLEEIKLDPDLKTVRKASPSCSSKSGQSWMGDTYRSTKQATVFPLAEEANNKNTQKTTEETSIKGTSKNNQRRLNSAPCQKMKQSSSKLLHNIASDSKCSKENLSPTNSCVKGSALFDPISFYSIGNLSSNNSGLFNLRKNLQPICLKAIPSGDRCGNNEYDMHFNKKKKFSAEMSRSMFFQSSKTKDFIDRDSIVPSEISSCFSSEDSSNPFDSIEFRENRFKCKRKRHPITGKSGLAFELQKSAQTELERNISPKSKQREYNTATSNYYNTSTDTYTMPFKVIHCGTQTDLSCFSSGDAQFFKPVPNRSVSNQWFMLHKATNTSNENCSISEKSNECLNMTSDNFLHLKINGNDEPTSKGSSHSNLHKSKHNNKTEKDDKSVNKPCCGNGCFSRLFSCCF